MAVTLTRDTRMLFEEKSIKLTDAQKRQLIADSIQRRDDWSTMSQTYRDNALEVRQLYSENRPAKQNYAKPDDAKQSSSNLRLPAIAQAVDGTHAQQHLATFPADERFFKAKPLNSEAKAGQVAYEEHIDNRLERVNFITKAGKDRLNLMLDGVSAVWHPFVRKEQKKTTYEPRKKWWFIIPGAPVKKVVDKVVLEMTDFVPLGMQDWWIDPTVDDLDDTNFIWRRWLPVNEIKEIDGFENTDEVDTYAAAAAPSDTEQSRVESMYQYIGIQWALGENEKTIAKHNAMLVEDWGDFYVDGECYENHVLIYSNDCNFHYFGENPYDHKMKPFTVTPYLPQSGTLFGKSLGHDIVPLAHAYDTFMNQVVDIVSTDGNPIWTYLTSDSALRQFFKDGKTAISPGMHIPCQNHDSLRKHDSNLQHLGAIAQFMQRCKDEIRESTGGVAYATGGIGEMDTNRTATEVNRLASGTNTRYQALILNYEQTRLKPYLYMLYENDRQFMSETVFVGDANEPLTPMQLKQSEYDFNVLGSKALVVQNREAQGIQQLITLIPQLLQTGTFKIKADLVEMDLLALVLQMGRIGGVRNINDVFEVVKTSEEMQQEQPGPQLGGDLQQLLGGMNGPQQIGAGGPTPNMAAA